MTDESTEKPASDVSAAEDTAGDGVVSIKRDEPLVPLTVDELAAEAREQFERIKKSETVQSIKKSLLEPVRNLRQEYGGRIGAGLRGLIEGFRGSTPAPVPSAERPKKKPARRPATTKKKPT